MFKTTRSTSKLKEIPNRSKSAKCGTTVQFKAPILDAVKCPRPAPAAYLPGVYTGGTALGDAPPNPSVQLHAPPMEYAVQMF